MCLHVGVGGGGGYKCDHTFKSGGSDESVVFLGHFNP